MARMVLQPGQVTEVVGNEVRTRPIEASSVILARYNLPSFKAEVLRRAGLPPADSGNSESKLVFDTLQASPARSAESLISTQVSSYSSSTAKKVLEVAFGMTKEAHEAEMQSTLAQMNIQFERATVGAKNAQQEYERAFTQLKDLKSKNEESSAALVGMVVAAASQSANELSRRAALYEDALNPARMYGTRPLAEMYIVPPGFLVPQSLLYMIAGAAIGLMLGILIVLFMSSRQRRT